MEGSSCDYRSGKVRSVYPGWDIRVLDGGRGRRCVSTRSAHLLPPEAGLSPYHFLRTFERLTHATPHQYLMRARLREAAVRLTADTGRVLDVALDSGFGDVSNFNRAFRAEFGVSPRAYRAQAGRSVRSPATRKSVPLSPR